LAGCRGGGERRSGQDAFLVPKVSFALRCRVGDRAEAGMSISPTPPERRELLPLLAQVLAGVTAAVNLFHDRALHVAQHKYWLTPCSLPLCCGAQ
jgi:hypothetical protein